MSALSFLLFTHLDHVRTCHQYRLLYYLQLMIPQCVLAVHYLQLLTQSHLSQNVI
jgi:hypothetical protein